MEKNKGRSKGKSKGKIRGKNRGIKLEKLIDNNVQETNFVG